MHRVWWHPSEWVNGLLIFLAISKPWRPLVYVIRITEIKSICILIRALRIKLQMLFTILRKQFSMCTLLQYVCSSTTKWVKWISNGKYCTSIWCSAIEMNRIKCTKQLQLTQSHIHSIYVVVSCKYRYRERCTVLICQIQLNFFFEKKKAKRSSSSSTTAILLYNKYWT